MSLDEVHVVADVLHTCTVHALTTECEEVMGILLGDVLKTENGKFISRIWRAVPQIRTDRRKDRVEPSHRQLSECITKADDITRRTGTLTRVIGWYHSHPHITVQPSHVDLQTQAQHQTLDEGFIGLIVSCFNKDQVIKCTAFQTMTAQDRMHSRSASSLDIDCVEDEELRLAIQTSMSEYNAANSGGNRRELRHKEVVLRIVQPIAECEYSLSDCASLHKTLFKEETIAYNKAFEEKGLTSLMRYRHSCVFHQSILQLINDVLIPSTNALITLEKQNSINLRQLDEQIEYLETRLSKRKQEKKPMELNDYLVGFPSIGTADLDLLGLVEGQLDAHFFEKLQISSEASNTSGGGPDLNPTRLRQDGHSFSAEYVETDGMGAKTIGMTTTAHPIERRPMAEYGPVRKRLPVSIDRRQAWNSIASAESYGFNISTPFQQADPPLETRTSDVSFESQRVPSGPQYVPFVTYSTPDDMPTSENSMTMNSTSIPSTFQSPVQNQRPSEQYQNETRYNPQFQPSRTVPVPDVRQNRLITNGRTHSAGNRMENRSISASRVSSPKTNGTTGNLGTPSQAENVPRMQETDDYMKSQRIVYRRPNNS